MGLCSLTHQIDALNILHELRAHATASNADGEGQCSGALSAGKVAVRPGDVMKEPRRMKTIAERARESCLTRLLEILTQLISVEEDFIKEVSYEKSLLKRKVICFFVCFSAVIYSVHSCCQMINVMSVSGNPCWISHLFWSDSTLLNYNTVD